MSGGLAKRVREIDPATGKYYISTAGASGVGSLSVSYDGSSGSYTIKDLAYNIRYTTSGPPTTSGIYYVFKSNTVKATDTLKIYGNVKGGTASLPIRLSYVSFGNWQHLDKSTKAKDDYYFYFGSRTPTSAMPKTGSASYKTYVTGNSVVTGYGAGDYEVSGTASFTANFGTSSVSTQLNLTRLDPNLGTAILPSYSGTASIGEGSFTGTLTSSDKSKWVAGFTGAFFGPTANEMAYTFGIYRYNPDPYGGAVPMFTSESIIGGGRRNQELT